MKNLVTQLEGMGKAYRKQTVSVSPISMDRVDTRVLRAIANVKQVPSGRWAFVARAVFAVRELPSLAPESFRTVLRPFGTAFSIVTVAFVGWIGAVAAFSQVLPGDALYQVKLASERAHFSLVRDPASQTELALEFAGRRLEEVAVITDRSLPDGNARVQTAMADFNLQIASAENHIKHVPQNQTAAVVKVIDRKAAAYRATIEQSANHLSGNTGIEVRAAKNAVQAISITAMTALVTDEHQGGSSVENVRITVGSKLRELEDSIQLIAVRLSNIPGTSYPEVTANGGPILQKLFAELNTARASLETGKNQFAAGGYSAAFDRYREAIGHINELEWGVGLYESALNVRAAHKDASTELKDEKKQTTNVSSEIVNP